MKRDLDLVRRILLDIEERGDGAQTTTRPDGKTYQESFTGEPTVLIRGSIAVVWGEYDFCIDGKFSHCGVDNIALAKVNGQWKIANFIWTVEREGCPTAPRND